MCVGLSHVIIIIFLSQREQPGSLRRILLPTIIIIKVAHSPSKDEWPLEISRRRFGTKKEKVNCKIMKIPAAHDLRMMKCDFVSLMTSQMYAIIVIVV